MVRREGNKWWLVIEGRGGSDGEERGEGVVVRREGRE